MQTSESHLNRDVEVLHDHFPAAHLTDVERTESDFLNGHK